MSDNVAELSYTHRIVDKHGEAVSEEFVDMTKEPCPFAEKSKYEFIRLCSKRPRMYVTHEKKIRTFHLCYSRGYINHYKDCKFFKEAQEK